MKALLFSSIFFLFFVSHQITPGGGGNRAASVVISKKLLFKQLRTKWKEVLAGSEVAQQDTAYNRRVQSMASSAQVAWKDMSKSDAASYLWPDLKSTTLSGQITAGYKRIKTMAIAYAIKAAGPACYYNPELKAAILFALDWMHHHRYYIRKPYENWFAWEIGAPMALNDIMVLMHDDLTAKQIKDWTAVIDHFCPHNAGDDADYKYWGANRAWRSTVHAVRGMVGEEASKMALARDGLSDLSAGHTGKRSVFKYVTEGDGFYKDGSFIQHFAVAYTGGYGKSLLANIADVLFILNDTPWEVTDPEKSHVWEWVQNAFMPLIYKHGQMMDMVRGREISRHGNTDIKVGAGIVATILRLSQLAPEPYKTTFRRAVKYWIPAIPDYYNFISIRLAAESEKLMNDASVLPMEEPVMNKVFAGMDRVVHLRKGWGLGLSMNSTRQSYYEAHTYNYENGKGWYTAEGMTYLYTDDPFHYGEGYWPTVNMHRLPGTTVDAGLIREDQSGYSWNPLTYSSKSWVGGASDGEYGLAGMEQDAWGASLTSKKSWFFFDDEVVALGAGITSADSRPIHTIIEARKLKKDGSNPLSVNGIVQPAKRDSQTVSFNQTKWIHLTGNVANSGIGYYFPEGATVKSLREARSGRWSDINRFNFPSGDPIITNSFQQLWFDHGTNPTNAAYAYVLLPNKAEKEVAAYAANPHISIIENSAAAQAVKEKRRNITAVNFWNDRLTSIRLDKSSFLRCNKKASLLLKEAASELTLSVSDPTQLNKGTIEIMIDKAASKIISADDRITVTSLSPQIKLTVNVKDAYGQTLSVKFKVSGKRHSAATTNKPVSK